MSPVLTGEFLTTGPPGTPPHNICRFPECSEKLQMLSGGLRGSTESVATLKILLFYEEKRQVLEKRETGENVGGYCRHSDERR